MKILNWSKHTYFNFFHLFSCVHEQAIIEAEGGDRYMPPIYFIIPLYLFEQKKWHQFCPVCTTIHIFSLLSTKKDRQTLLYIYIYYYYYWVMCSLNANSTLLCIMNITHFHYYSILSFSIFFFRLVLYMDFGYII